MTDNPDVQSGADMYMSDAVALYDTCPAPNYTNVIKFIRQMTTVVGSAFDVGCGTGSLIRMLRDDGWDSHGCDISQSMIKAARLKNPSANIEIQSATHFESGKKVDLITCTFDVLNHLESQSAMKNFFRRSFDQLRKDGTLIFDSLTPNDINMNWDRYVEVDSLDDFYLIRRGKKIGQGVGVLTYDFFKKIDEEKWLKTTEVHTLVAPSLSWIEDNLRSVGFTEIRTLDAIYLTEPNFDTVRWIFSASKTTV